MQSKEGFYRLQFMGATGQVGAGVIVLDSGIIVGADTAVTMDGTYSYSERDEMLDLQMTAKVPPGVSLVQGIPALALEHRFWVRARIPKNFTGSQVFDAETQYGPIKFRLEKIRDFPAD